MCRGMGLSLPPDGAGAVEHKGPLDNHYRLGRKVLGEGAFGKVVQGVDKATGEAVAIKVIDTAKVDSRRLQTEIQAQARASSHQHICGLRGVFRDARRVYMVLDLCSGGELNDWIEEQLEDCSLDFARAGTFLRQLLSAVDYLHSLGIVHRDIKPENVLLQGRRGTEEVRLADFGLAAFVGDEVEARMKAGSPGFSAPEVLAGASCTDKCDVWSCGVLAYYLLSGSLPFGDGTPEEVAKQARSGVLDFGGPAWQQVPLDAQRALRSMLQVDPNMRPDIRSLLESGWLADV